MPERRRSSLSPDLLSDLPIQDKIGAFWDISRRELESGRAELRNREREVEDLQEQHQIELKARAPAACLSSTHCTLELCLHALIRWHALLHFALRKHAFEPDLA